MPAKLPTWLPVRIGELRHLCNIQSQTSTPDAVGQPVQTWTTIDTQYAKIRAVTQRELVEAGVTAEQVSHSITMRCGDVVYAPGMRVTWSTHTYHVEASDNIDERGIMRKLLVLEINATD